MKKLILTLLIFTGLITGVWWLLFKEKSPQKAPAESISEYQVYRNVKGGYEMAIPGGWNISEATAGGRFVSRIAWRATVKGLPLGNISQISVSVIATPAGNQPLSTLKEFDEWTARNNGTAATDSGIVKVSNGMISGFKAVIMKEEAVIENDPLDSFFSQTCWVRRDELDYYINVMGNGTFTDSEKQYFDKILNSFKLI